MRLQLLNALCAVAVLVLGYKTVTSRHSVLYSIGDGPVGQDAMLQQYGQKHTHSGALKHNPKSGNYRRTESLSWKKSQHKQSQLCQSIPLAYCYPSYPTPERQASDYSNGGYFYFYPNVHFFHLPPPPPPPPPPSPPPPPVTYWNRPLGSHTHGHDGEPRDPVRSQPRPRALARAHSVPAQATLARRARRYRSLLLL